MANWFVRFFLNLVSPQTCIAAAIRKKGKILLTRRSSHIIEGGKWCLPGGHLDKGETAMNGVMREVREETGLKTKRARFLFYHDELMPRLRLHALVLVFEVDVSGSLRPNWEVSESKWCTPDEALKLELAFTHRDIIRKLVRGVR